MERVQGLSHLRPDSNWAVKRSVWKPIRCTGRWSSWWKSLPHDSAIKKPHWKPETTSPSAPDAWNRLRSIGDPLHASDGPRLVSWTAIRACWVFLCLVDLMSWRREIMVYDYFGAVGCGKMSQAPQVTAIDTARCCRSWLCPSLNRD